jgi:NAD(P)-dependent dehydrogenase (short-subunit alcohol dehydrogenase family)
MIKTGLNIAELKGIDALISLKHKKAFITGAAGGIGRASACVMAQAGADICLTDLPQKQSELDDIARYLSDKHGARATTIVADLTDEAAVVRMIKHAADTLGAIDIVHSNAGISSPQDNANMSMEFWHKIVATNLTSNLLVSRESAKVMRKNGHGGSIILTSSMSGYVVNRRPPGQHHIVGYCAVKAGVRQMAKGLAMDFLADKIRVNSISPGYVLSGLHEQWTDELMDYVTSNIPMGRFADLNEVMGPILFLASDMSSYCTGTDICFDGGFTVW